MTIRCDESHSARTRQHDATAAIVGNLQVMEVEAAHIRAGNGGSRSAIHHERSYFVAIAHANDVASGVAQERKASRVAEARVRQQGVVDGLCDAAKCRGRIEDVSEAFTQQAGVMRQVDLTIQGQRGGRVAMSHKYEVGLIRHIRWQRAERVLIRTDSRRRTGGTIGIDPDHEVTGVGRTGRSLARIVRQDVDVLFIGAGRHTPRALYGHQHPIAGREAGEVARRHEAREAPVDDPVHIRPELLVVRDHEPERQIVRDPAFDATSEADRLLARVLLVRVHPRITAQPRSARCERHTKLKVRPLQSALHELCANQSEPVPKEHQVGGQSRRSNEVGVVGRRDVGVRAEVENRAERLEPETGLVVAMVQRRLVVVPVTVHSEDAIESFRVQTRDQARIEAAGRVVRQIDATVRSDEPIFGTPDRGEGTELREAVRVPHTFAGLVANIKVRPVQTDASAEAILLQRGHPAVVGQRLGCRHLPRGTGPESQQEQ